MIITIYLDPLWLLFNETGELLFWDDTCDNDTFFSNPGFFSNVIVRKLWFHLFWDSVIEGGV